MGFERVGGRVSKRVYGFVRESLSLDSLAELRLVLVPPRAFCCRCLSACALIWIFRRAPEPGLMPCALLWTEDAVSAKWCFDYFGVAALLM